MTGEDLKHFMKAVKAPQAKKEQLNGGWGTKPRPVGVVVDHGVLRMQHPNGTVLTRLPLAADERLKGQDCAAIDLRGLQELARAVSPTAEVQLVIDDTHLRATVRDGKLASQMRFALNTIRLW